MWRNQIVEFPHQNSVRIYYCHLITQRMQTVMLLFYHFLPKANFHSNGFLKLLPILSYSPGICKEEPHTGLSQVPP
jgi:hypothetical protein